MGAELVVAQHARTICNRHGIRKACLALCILQISIAACHDDQEKYYAAVKAVPIYREPIDGTEDVVYEAKKGEICIFGKEITKKVYMFRQATCGDAHGWTPDWPAFEEVNRATAKDKKR